MKLGAYCWIVGGHTARFDEDADEWVYADDLSAVGWPHKRPCPRCGRMPTEEGHDACIANLPGVISACCGHGVGDKALYPFVIFDDGEELRGEEAAKWIKENDGE